MATTVMVEQIAPKKIMYFVIVWGFYASVLLLWRGQHFWWWLCWIIGGLIALVGAIIYATTSAAWVNDLSNDQERENMRLIKRGSWITGTGLFIALSQSSVLNTMTGTVLTFASAILAIICLVVPERTRSIQVDVAFMLLVLVSCAISLVSSSVGLH